jgi:hypothetical protein
MTNQPYARASAPRQLPLSYWLSQEAPASAQALTPSALREMAWNFGQFRGLAAVCLGVGAACLGGTGLTLLARPAAIAVLVGLFIAGAALLGSGLLLLRRMRRRVPSVRPVMSSRAPGKLSSGIGLTVFLSLVLGVLLLPAAFLLADGPGGMAAVVALYVLFLVATTSVFALPAYFMEHARRDFRAAILADPELRSALEAMALVWTDPVGYREFGPL